MVAKVSNLDVPAPTPSRWFSLGRLAPGRRTRFRTESDPGLTAEPGNPNETMKQFASSDLARRRDLCRIFAEVYTHVSLGFILSGLFAHATDRGRLDFAGLARRARTGVWAA